MYFNRIRIAEVAYFRSPVYLRSICRTKRKTAALGLGNRMPCRRGTVFSTPDNSHFSRDKTSLEQVKLPVHHWWGNAISSSTCLVPFLAYLASMSCCQLGFVLMDCISFRYSYNKQLSRFSSDSKRIKKYSCSFFVILISLNNNWNDKKRYCLLNSKLTD